MTNKEIADGWARAERLVESIWSAYVTGVSIEQAKKDQISLIIWLGIVKEARLVYNGCYDDFVTLRL